jgi:hypothetical protein
MWSRKNVTSPCVVMMNMPIRVTTYDHLLHRRNVLLHRTPLRRVNCDTTCCALKSLSKMLRRNDGTAGASLATGTCVVVKAAHDGRVGLMRGRPSSQDGGVVHPFGLKASVARPCCCWGSGTKLK